MWGWRQGVGATLRPSSMLAIAFLLACGGDKSPSRREARETFDRDTVRRVADTVESGGDVASDVVTGVANSPVKERWITDANVLALLGAMHARQIAAADVELESWHVDAIRAFAASVAREHAELQHSADSVAARLGLTPASPALAKQWLSTMQAQIDSMRRVRESSIDRAFVHQQVSGQQLMMDYVTELESVAERPEVRALLAATATRVSLQLAHARSLQTAFPLSDSSTASGKRQGTEGTARL